MIKPLIVALSLLVAAPVAAVAQQCTTVQEIQTAVLEAQARNPLMVQHTLSGGALKAFVAAFHELVGSEVIPPEADAIVAISLGDDTRLIVFIESCARGYVDINTHLYEVATQRSEAKTQ